MTAVHPPWLKWFPADWRSDPRLRMCSLAARGLWIELIGFMHEADPYGHLVVGGSAPSATQIAALVGAPLASVKKCLAELKNREVFSENSDGLIFSRRVVRDRAKAELDRRYGGTGGNPNLKANRGIDGDGGLTQSGDPNNTTVTGRGNGGVNPPVNGGDKAARVEAPATYMPDARKEDSVGSREPTGGTSPPPTADPRKAFYDLAKEILGKGSGGQATKLLGHCGDDCGRASDLLRLAKGKSDSQEYIGAILRGDAGARADDVLAETERLYRDLGVS